MGIFDGKDKSKIFKGKTHKTCPCGCGNNDCGCNNPTNDPTPPTNCVWIFYWDLFDDGGITPIQSGSNHAPNASPVLSRNLGQLPAGPDYMLRLTVETVVSPVPTGILFNAFNSSLDIVSVNVNNAPISVPVGLTQILGEVSILSSAGVHQAGIKAEGQCSELEIIFDYEIV